MSRFMVQTLRFSVLVLALLFVGAAEPGALAQPGDTGDEAICHFHAGAITSCYQMHSDTTPE